MGASSKVAARVAAMASASAGIGSSGWESAMVTVQWHAGDRPAGTRGGRWIGRICALGLVAMAVASNVGSSMSWHMATT